MRHARSVILCVLAPVAVLAACSSDKNSGSSAFIQQYCSLLKPCCQPSTSGGDPGSGCVGFYSFFASNVDAALGDACLAEIRTHQGEMTFCSNVAALTPSCDKALSASTTTGTKGPGETCSSSRDCAPSSEGKVSCEFGSSAQTPMCQLVIDGKAGDAPCIGTKTGPFTTGFASGTNPPPSRGFVCDLAKNVWCNDKSGACEATRNLGDACMISENGACGATGECGSSDKCVAKTPSTGAPAMDPSLLIVCSTMSSK